MANQVSAILLAPQDGPCQCRINLAGGFIMAGYCGKFLRINFSTGQIEKEDLDLDLAMN